MTMGIVLYMLCGVFNGYFSNRIYKSAEGAKWYETSLLGASLFPGIVFSSGFGINMYLWYYQSSGALPFGTMLALFALWLCVSVPLVLAGGYFGFRKAALSFPVGVNQIPRQIPEQPWYMNPVVCVLVGGIL